MNIREEEMNANLKRQVEDTIKKATELLYLMDSEIDKMEGKDVHKAMLNLQEHLLQWNMLGHNFAFMGIQDWLDEPLE